MRTSKFTARRTLGLLFAGSLAATGVIAVQNSAQAATTIPSATVAPATGGSTGGGVIAITGTGFKVGSTVKAKAVGFVASTAACGTSLPTSLATAVSVTSATALTAKLPTLTGSTAGTKYIVCVYDGASGTVAAIGQGSFTAYTTPTLTKLNGAAVTSAQVASDSIFGGSPITVEGTSFTGTAKIKVGSVTLATKVVDATTLTATLPSHVAGSGLIVSVADMGGTAKAATAANATVSYKNAIKVSPSNGSGDASEAISVTGIGFDDLNFGDTLAAASTKVVLVKAGTSLAIGSDLSATGVGAIVCQGVNVVSDSQLTCKPGTIEAAKQGAYTVVVATTDADAKVLDGATGYSAAATYTVSDF